MKHVEPDLDNFRVWQIRADATEPKQPGHILAVNKYTENNLGAFEQKGIRQSVEDQLNAVTTCSGRIWRRTSKIASLRTKENGSRIARN